MEIGRLASIIPSRILAILPHCLILFPPGFLTCIVPIIGLPLSSHPLRFLLLCLFIQPNHLQLTPCCNKACQNSLLIQLCHPINLQCPNLFHGKIGLIELCFRLALGIEKSSGPDPCILMSNVVEGTIVNSVGGSEIDEIVVAFV